MRNPSGIDDRRYSNIVYYNEMCEWFYGWQPTRARQDENKYSFPLRFRFAPTEIVHIFTIANALRASFIQYMRINAKTVREKKTTHVQFS